jgi:3-dehydroquinate synthase
MLFNVDASGYFIEIGSLLDGSLETLMNNNYADSKKVIVVDENTNEFCLDFLITNFDCLKDAEVIMIPAGEENKLLDICAQVWLTLDEYKIGRSDVVINLGGGMITDLGGFMASLYMRGIDYINIPTSLLAMVDASVGGKTGVDHGGIKNLIGVFSSPKAVFIDPTFLSTLPEGEFYSGFAEMLKHGLIISPTHWSELSALNDVQLEINEKHIYASIVIKNEIVHQDPFEKDERKKLNFGHTIGHALESYFLDKDPISHGYAVILGVLCESFISFKRNYITMDEFSEIERVIVKNYQLLDLSSEDYSEIKRFMKSDKKNRNNKILGVLLIGIGEAIINQEYSDSEITDAFDYLNRLYAELINS